jgi:hypothetical protein
VIEETADAGFWMLDSGNAEYRSLIVDMSRIKNHSLDNEKLKKPHYNFWPATSYADSSSSFL